MYDIVIIGSGVAGSMCAKELSESGLEVLVLEAGGNIKRSDLVLKQLQSTRDDSMSPYPLLPHALHPDPIDAPDYPASAKRKYETSFIRTVGGTTWHWGGAAWRYMPDDFKMKSKFGVGRDWSINYSDIEPYYVRAEREMGVSGTEIENLSQWRSTPFPLPAVPLSYMDEYIKEHIASIGLSLDPEPAARNTLTYDGRPSCCGSNNCIPICPVGAQYSASHTLDKALKKGCNLIENAVVYQLVDSKSGLIQEAKYLTPDGKKHSVKGRYFILAANAVETAKILLMSKTTNSPNGIANSSNLVGKHLMDHPTIHATFDLAEAVFSGRGPVGITAITDYMEGPFRSKFAAKKIAIGNGNFTEIIAKELINEFQLGKVFEDKLKFQSVRRIGSHTQHEQLPDENNKVVLSKTKFDDLGLPYPEVHWDIDDYVIESAKHSAEVYKKIGNAIGSVNTKISFNLASNAHMLGTTIMGNNEKTSVVNSDCITHDHPNLFIAGGAVFASSSSVNPTLTVAALSIRIADKLKSLVKD